MAVDEVLLAEAASSEVATFRFYQWDEPTLSLGYFQSIADRESHAPSRGCACVRRQSGGGAILHDRELTYSLTLPAGHRLARQTELLYREVHEAFIEVLNPIVDRGESGLRLARRNQKSNTAASQEPFLCFERRAVGDVVASLENGPTSDSNVAGSAEDWKILGSAQRRYRGAVLQHGSLLLGASPAAPKLLGLAELAGVAVDPRSLAESVASGIGLRLGIELSRGIVPSSLESMAAELANSKYEAATWTNRR